MNQAKAILTHLRFPFSFFLLPIFLFAASHSLPWIAPIWPLLIVLHLLVYPSSNGYNSLMDNDTGSIGGIKYPEKVPKAMITVSFIMDGIALILTFLWYGWTTTGLILLYILASRAYSYRGIRLKKNPIIGYLIVVLFQGALIFIATVWTLTNSIQFDLTTALGACVSALLIGASYPLTQVYQHQQDAEDGVISLSALLGIKGTFVFAIVAFLLLNVLMFAYLELKLQSIFPFLMFLMVSGPAGMYLVRWMRLVWRDPIMANYENTMKMSKIGSACMNVFFLALLVFEIIAWQPWN